MPAHINEHMDGNYLVRVHSNGFSERVLISPEPPPAPRPRIVITNILCDDAESIVDIAQGEVTCSEGASVAVSAELRAPDESLIPLTAMFRMPLVARDGRETIIRAPVADGIATISATLPESGCWRVTESAINQDLPDDLQMDFAGLTVFVVR